MKRAQGTALRAIQSVLAIAAGLILANCTLSTTATAMTRVQQAAELTGYSKAVLNNQLRYIHGTSYSILTSATIRTETTDESGTVNTTDTIVEAIVPPGGFGVGESAIRPQASALYATAIALHTNTYDEMRVGVSREVALRRTVAWVNGLVVEYQPNRTHWGHAWQSALWVYYTSYGAHEVWSSIPTATRELDRQMVASEANHLLTIPPPFYRGRNGRIIFVGDSKSEENAWNATLLLLAAREYPSDSNAPAWETQGRRYAITAYATPCQVGHDPRITGSNLNWDGTVVNHGKINPDYMFSDCEMIMKYDLASFEAGVPVPTECYNNVKLVWRALTRLKFSPRKYKKPGGTIFGKDRKGHASSAMYYPMGADWSRYRRFNAAQTDVEIFCLGKDAMAYSWASSHLRYVLGQQRRHPDGHIFSRGESHYGCEEQFAAASAAEMVERLSYIR